MLPIIPVNMHAEAIASRGIKYEKSEEIKVEKPEIKNESVEIKQEKPEEKKAKDDGIEVKILKDLPKFVDEYEKYHGPFNAGQIVKVPRHVADMLLKSKSATPISNL